MGEVESDSEDDKQDCMAALHEHENKTSSAKACKTPVSQDQLKVLSWNIDGLDEVELDVRTIYVTEIINNELPDVVMLQEVVDKSLQILQALCQNYVFVVHKITHYYSIIMVKEDQNMTLTKKKIVNYPTTAMGRFLLEQNLIIFGHPFVIMTTHLESTKDAKLERKDQLGLCFNAISASTDNVIFSGDLNVREQEIKELGGLPVDVNDAWIVNGSQSKERFTWDMMLNDNLKFPGNSKPRARFDRMFYKPMKSTPLHCTTFSLVGTSRIEACRKFPSDHFGMLVTFRYVK